MVDYTEGAGFQYHIHTTYENTGNYAIITGDPGRCELIASYLDHPKKIAENREYVTYTGELHGISVSVTSTGIGGPSTAIAIEELYKCGVHTIIRIGTCGGMQLHIQGGDAIIATGAIRMEGTSKEYAPIEFPAVADYFIVQELVNAAKQNNMTYHVGVVECKDSFYGEVDTMNSPVAYELSNKWNAWIKCGALASEMESAALYIIGSIRKIRVGTILLALDNQEREKHNMTNKQVHDITGVIQVVIDAMTQIIDSDLS